MPSDLGSRIAIAAKAYEGTKYRHQGSDPTGLDCIGLLIQVADDVGLNFRDLDNPMRRVKTNGLELIGKLRLVSDELPVNDFESYLSSWQLGDVQLFWFPLLSNIHVAIAVEHEGELAFAHAALANGRTVVQHPTQTLIDGWVGAYRVRDTLA